MAYPIDQGGTRCCVGAHAAGIPDPLRGLRRHGRKAVLAAGISGMRGGVDGLRARGSGAGAASGASFDDVGERS